MPEFLPFYSIYGEAPRELDLQFVHVERVLDRGALHGGHVLPHRHADLHQLSLWHDAEGVYEFEGRRLTLRSDTLTIMPAGVVHGFDVTIGSDATVISLSDDFRARCLAGANERVTECLRTSLVLPIPEEQRDEARHLFGIVEREYRHFSWGQAEAIGSHVRLIALLAARLRQAGAGTAAPARGRLLQRFHHLLEKHLREHWPLARYTANLGTTPYLLQQAVMEGHGLSATMLIRKRMTTEAKRLLRYTNLQVTEISGELGYDDPTHFARSFRRETDETPAAWRRRQIESMSEVSTEGAL